ncbi:MAG: hypothetical protein FOGNACKC_02923 [Anaerolineae bacterium]|nr:hypothetical protein [Anaerolineae bacterium]
MFYEIRFGRLAAMLVDFVDQPDGFFYLRLAGPEPTVNAVWAYLAGRDRRRHKWQSEVTIPRSGQAYPLRVLAETGVTYRRLRTALPSGLIDLALIHPRLTVAEDSEWGFHLLSYDEGCPPAFFARLNQCLSIPIQAAWTDWLWRCGQQPQATWSLKTRTRYDGRQPVEVEELVEDSVQPIRRLDSLGQVACYAVECHDEHKAAWLQIIRTELKLGLVLPPAAAGHQYQGEGWTVTAEAETWTLSRGRDVVLTAPSRTYLLTQARDKLGMHLVIQEE